MVVELLQVTENGRNDVDGQRRDREKFISEVCRRYRLKFYPSNQL